MKKLSKQYFLLLGIVTVIGIGGYLLWSQLQVDNPDNVDTLNNNERPGNSNEAELLTDIRVISQNTNLYNYLQRTGTRQYTSFLNTVLTDRFIIFSCSISGDTVPGVMLVETPSDEIIPPEISNTEIKLAAWEPYIIQDMGKFLFPKIPNLNNIILYDYKNNSHFTGRQASFSVQGQTYEVFYGWELAYLFISSSELCVEEMISTVYSPGEHIHD